MATIVVAEDDEALRELYALALENHGYAALEAADGKQALALIEAGGVDAVVCDVMMPRMDGIELTRALRAAGNDVPVLMVTAKGALADKGEGFTAGADDYVVKPVDIAELLWRIEALLRRAHIEQARSLTVGDTTLDASALCVTCGGQTVQLPAKEFHVLLKLLSSPGRVFTRRQLLEDVWGEDAPADGHTLDVHISRLRERFRDNGDFEIVTVRGLGYKGVCTHG